MEALRTQTGNRALGGCLRRRRRSLVSAQGVIGLLLQHIAEALDFGIEVGRVGLQRPLGLRLGLLRLGLLLLLLLLLGPDIDQRIGLLLGRRRRRRVDGRVVGFLGSRRWRILRRHDARARVREESSLR